MLKLVLHTSSSLLLLCQQFENGNYVAVEFLLFQMLQYCTFKRTTFYTEHRSKINSVSQLLDDLNNSDIVVTK